MSDTSEEFAKIRATVRSHWFVGLGGIFAATISVLLNQSFWWGVLHYFCGWFYVLYAFTVRHESTVAGIRRLLDFFK